MERRASVARAVNYVDAESFFQEVRGPAAAAIGSAHPIGALPAAAVDHHDRIRVPHLRGDPIFDVHLAAGDYGAAGEFGAFDAEPEVTPLGEVERGVIRCHE